MPRNNQQTTDESTEKYYLCVTCGNLKNEELFREGACTCEDCHNEGRSEVRYREAPDGDGFVLSDSERNFDSEEDLLE